MLLELMFAFLIDINVDIDIYIYILFKLAYHQSGHYHFQLTTKTQSVKKMRVYYPILFFQQTRKCQGFI